MPPFVSPSESSVQQGQRPNQLFMTIRPCGISNGQFLPIDGTAYLHMIFDLKGCIMQQEYFFTIIFETPNVQCFHGSLNNNFFQFPPVDGAKPGTEAALGLRNDFVTRAMLASIGYFIYDLWAMFKVHSLKLHFFTGEQRLGFG